MSDFAPLLILLLFWFFFGSRISKIKKAAKNAAGKGSEKTAAPKPKQEKGVSFEEAFSDPAPAAPVRTQMSPIVPSPSLSEGGSAWVNKRTSVGSLGEDTLEGIDPCHDDQAQEMTLLRTSSTDNDSAAPPELTLSWARNDVVRGFVYGEILNRRKSVS